MKKYIIFLITLTFFSCSLTDSIDQNPPDNLVEENVVQNESDARALLNGAYTVITSSTNSSYYMYTELIPSTLIGSMSEIAFSRDEGAQFMQNDILANNQIVNNYWTIFYSVIDAANSSISLTNKLPSTEISATIKNEIIGEAHFIRAMATFDALRYFGQFYDMNSDLGIILRTEPVNFVTRSKPRSTVKDCYDQIISDLDFAIANAPDFSVTYRASKTAAKALKSRILLFMKQYVEAATIADEVILETTRSLESDFASVFSKGLNSSEMILMTHRDENSDIEDRNAKRFYRGRTGTTWYPIVMDGDPRQALTYFSRFILKTNNEDTFRPTYFIRLAEMYLIKAEGLTMSGADLITSKAPLDVIRNRAGIGESSALTIEELKDDIFNEITRELGFENGSEWFAAIRFDKAMTLKPTITSTNQYILPIPEEEINGNTELTLSNQNPGYQ